ncbi:SMI1/KNR4 family protein [Pseudomonas chlororaphis]|uniref:SMI1/KNR4 family protein n=1 Tax=Pseudomonas chlororaphis TaxID=587753 RepID=UPI001B305D3C|nr:SMI1/KNR4 family protein [Pseudomonas chlororaphis]QTT83333.1 SMI1/KNR4 family protein [Pseudomonas chlororaphis]
MIPSHLIKLIEKQPGDIYRDNKDSVIDALNTLNISLDSEIGEFFLNYAITFFQGNTLNTELLDIVDPSNEIEACTNFIHEVWELPEDFISLTGIQGEGCYLYDKNSGEVLDFDLAKRDEFLAGEHQLKWNSFFEFLTWYLS